MKDQQLLRAYLAGDAGSLSSFFGRHQDSLLRFAATVTGDEHAAQDVVQETFLAVLRKPRQLLGVDSCNNWLLRVVRNRAIDHVRRRARDRRHLHKLEPATTTGPASGDLEAADDRELVRREIAALPTRHREVVVLRIQEGKSYAEIGEITGLSVPAVGNRLHEAMKILTQRLRRKDRVS